MELKIGEAYFVETPTFSWIGRLVSIDGPYTITLDTLVWVADTGRHRVFFANGRAENMEIEPHPPGNQKMLQWISIERWCHPIPTEPFPL